MGNQFQYPYQPEEQGWNSQPIANYPNDYSNREGYGISPQQAGYQGQTPASPYPGNQGMYPQQPGYAGNNPYAGNSSYANNNPYAVPPTTYQPPANPYAPPSAYTPYMQAPYGMVDPYSNKANTGLTLGIIAIILSLIGWVIPFGEIAAVVCGILGIVFSSQGRQSITKKQSATTGLTLSIISVVISSSLFLCGLFGLLALLAA